MIQVENTDRAIFVEIKFKITLNSEISQSIGKSRGPAGSAGIDALLREVYHPPGRRASVEFFDAVTPLEQG